MPTRVLTGTYWVLSLIIAVFPIVALGFALQIGFAEVLPHLVHYLADWPLPLFAHVIFAPLALALAPFQFWTGLRTTRPRVHRIIGYTYVVSIMVAGAASLVMLGAFKGTLWAAAGFGVLAVLWMVSTAMAVNFARKRDFTRHRQWMKRSAALTFAAVTLRLIMLPLVLSGMTGLETYNITAWASWLLPLIAVELWARRSRPKHQPARV